MVYMLCLLSPHLAHADGALVLRVYDLLGQIVQVEQLRKGARYLRILGQVK